MPRGFTSGKRHQAANGNGNANATTNGVSNNSDTRHENGLVGPGKRVVRQRNSQFQMNGKADRSAVSPLPTCPMNGFADETVDEANSTKDCVRASDASLETQAAMDYAQSPSTETLTAPPTAAPCLSEKHHRQIDVNDAKNHNVHHDPGPVELALNVLRSCPLQDTIAILIILMNVSPTALTWIYMLFTLLTFVVPPVTTSSGLSITEMFDGNQATPSLTTLVCMDVVMLGIWLFLWAPVQQFILDLSHVVISLTLGGGGSSRQGVARNIFLCIAMVVASQWTRHLRFWGLAHVGSLMGAGWYFPADPDDPSEVPMPSFERQGPYGWFRSIFAIHIVTQGLVRYIREWYLRRERRDLLSQSLFVDAEAGKMVGEDGTTTTPSDGDGPSTASATAVSAKQRRKQSALIRIRQPLWAALASTKIVMVKEYELQHAASESAGSNAIDIHNLGNATFNTQPGQIWICHIGSGEVCFNTSHFPNADQAEVESCEEDSSIDRSKPFYVRVNKAVWQPTRIFPIEGGEEVEAQGSRWSGDIYGLTPLSHYECEFVCTRTDEVMLTTSLRTLAARTTDAEATPKAGQRSHRRPDSPATTLRACIRVTEQDLADKKARLKLARKDHHRKVTNIRKEIDKLTSSAQSAGSNDDKLRQKAAQNRNLKSQAEEACQALEEQLRDVDSLPKLLRDKKAALEDEWKAVKAQHDEAMGAFKAFKGTIDKEIKTLEDEEASLQAKRTKIATRIAKAESDHARVTDANRQGLDEVQRREHERVLYDNDMRRLEQQYHHKIEQVQAANEYKSNCLVQFTGQMQAYADSPALAYAAPAWAASPSSHFAVPATQGQQTMWPPTSMPASQSPAAPSMLAVAQSPFQKPLQPVTGTPPQQTVKTRARSSSMLSDVSGFTQSTDDEDRSAQVMAGPQPVLDHGQNARGGTNPHGHVGAAPMMRPPPGLGFPPPTPHARQQSHGSYGSASASASGPASAVGSSSDSPRSGSRSRSGGRSPI